MCDRGGWEFYLFFRFGASFFVLVGGAAVGGLPLLVRFPHLALMGKLTPVWVVILWSVAERTHGICLRFACRVGRASDCNLCVNCFNFFLMLHSKMVYIGEKIKKGFGVFMVFLFFMGFF